MFSVEKIWFIRNVSQQSIRTQYTMNRKGFLPTSVVFGRELNCSQVHLNSFIELSSKMEGFTIRPLSWRWSSFSTDASII